MSEQREGELLHGRSVSMYVYGADMEALEMAALDEARKFFGDQMHLEVIHDYQVFTYSQEPPERHYAANVTVREIG